MSENYFRKKDEQVKSLLSHEYRKKGNERIFQYSIKHSRKSKKGRKVKIVNANQHF